MYTLHMQCALHIVNVDMIYNFAIWKTHSVESKSLMRLAVWNCCQPMTVSRSHTEAASGDLAHPLLQKHFIKIKACCEYFNTFSTNSIALKIDIFSAELCATFL